MNKFVKIVSLATSVLVIGACNGDETVSDPEATKASEQAGSSNSEETESTISLHKFELNIDYEGTGNDFDVSYEVEKNVEAAYEDEINKMLLTGDAAYQQIEPVLSAFDFTIDTPDDEVIQDVIKGFEIEDGFQSVEIEITFDDGTEKEYELELE